MIIVELVDNETRERRYSDANVMIRQIETGSLYEDAVDVIPCKYTYEETDVPIDPEPEPEPEPTPNDGGIQPPPFFTIPTSPVQE